VTEKQSGAASLNAAPLCFDALSDNLEFVISLTVVHQSVCLAEAIE